MGDICSTRSKLRTPNRSGVGVGILGAALRRVAAVFVDEPVRSADVVFGTIVAVGFKAVAGAAVGVDEDKLVACAGASCLCHSQPINANAATNAITTTSPLRVRLLRVVFAICHSPSESDSSGFVGGASLLGLLMICIIGLSVGHVIVTCPTHVFTKAQIDGHIRNAPEK